MSNEIQQERRLLGAELEPWWIVDLRHRIARLAAPVSLDFVAECVRAGLIAETEATAILDGIAEKFKSIPDYRKPDIDDVFAGLPPLGCSWIDAANDTRPAWTYGRAIWSEDDAGTPDRERIADAWLRLFGRSYEHEPVLASWDGGDSFGYLHPGGISSWCYCGLGQIELMRPCAVTGNPAIDAWNLGGGR